MASSPRPASDGRDPQVLSRLPQFRVGASPMAERKDLDFTYSLIDRFFRLSVAATASMSTCVTRAR